MQQEIPPTTTLEPSAQPAPEAPKLDFAKLLGFRNLLPVTTPESDPVDSSDLAFNKRGTETIA